MLVVVIAAVAAGAVLLPRFMRTTVQVTKPVRGPVVQAFYATGTVQPQREYPIRAAVAGVLAEVKVDKGAAVKAGDVLAVIDDPERRFTLAKAEAELREKQQRCHPETSPVLREMDAKIASANALFDIAKREQERVERIGVGNGVTTVDVDRALDRVKTMSGEMESMKALRDTKRLELEREVAVAEAALREARQNVDLLTLRAPVDGVVLDRPTSQGTRVAINDVILRLADVTPEKLVMRAAVDEEDIAQVEVGQKVRMSLYAFAGRPFVGTVARIYDEADSNRRTFEVDVKITDPEKRLAPGMTGELAFIREEKAEATVLPASAARDKASAVLVVRNGVVERVTATFGLKSIERVELTSTLGPDELVIISPVGDEIVGRKVQTKLVDPAAAAGLDEGPKTPMKGVGVTSTR
jgi:multidrug resistance efflux pump